MTQRPTLTPLGTARTRIGRAPASGTPFPDDLVALSRAQDLGEEKLHLAWELARLVAHAEGDGFRGLLVLLLLLFDAAARGSTRMPIDGASREALRARALELGLSRADVRRAESAADEILRGSGRVAESPRRQLELGFGTGARAPVHVLVGEPGDRRPLVLSGEGAGASLAMSRFEALEARLASRLRGREPPLPDRAAVEHAVARIASDLVALTEEQQRAVALALLRPVTVITGGPGTGKTSIVIAILRALARLPESGAAALTPASIAIAAPTGKAADRLKEQVHERLRALEGEADRALAASLPEPKTVHRLLDWAPRDERFRRHEGSPLAERLVIVDEASMLDVALAERLVAALRPDARLVLLGDADQLPSVDAGAVLADLVRAAEPGDVPTLALARLTQSHRMDPRDPAGSHVLSVAQRVRAGASLTLSSGSALEPGTLRSLDTLERGVLPPGVSFFRATTPARREAFLRAWLEARILGGGEMERLAQRTLDVRADDASLRALFDHAASARLLTVTRGASRATGADAVNAWVASRIARERGQPDLGHPLAGEPVMVVRNDYERQLWNGDTGLVLWLGERAPMVAFRRGGETRAFRLDAVRPVLERAHAVTVHKAQGSEHEAIALLLPDEDVPRLLTREIVYTAITRARRSVVIVGDPALLERAVARPSARDTGLAASLTRGS